MSEVSQIEAISVYDAAFMWRDAAELGHTIASSSHIGAFHYVDLAGDGSVNFYNFAGSSPFYDEGYVAKGYQLGGVLRRQGIRKIFTRELLDLPPEALRLGDRLVLEHPSLSDVTTLSITEFLSS